MPLNREVAVSTRAQNTLVLIVTIDQQESMTRNLNDRVLCLDSDIDGPLTNIVIGCETRNKRCSCMPDKQQSCVKFQYSWRY